jgi:hypothetical protein
MRTVLAWALLSLPGICAAQCTYSNVTTSTFASTLAGASGGSTICLAPGNYGQFNGASKSGMVTIQPDTAHGGNQANVTFGGINFLSASNITMNNMTISGGTLGNTSTPATHIHLTNIVFTGSVCINTPTDANIDVLIDSSSFNNVGQSCTEGRLGITGNNHAHSAANGVTISNTTFIGSGSIPNNCSDGIQINGDAYGTVIGPGNQFINIVQSSCVAHVDSIQFYGARNTTITGNFFFNTSDGIMSSNCNGSPMTVTNNVFVQDPTSATNEVIVTGGNGDIFDHNTFGSAHSTPRFGNPNGCGLNANITITNTILMGGIVLTDGQSASSFTENHNLMPGGGAGAGTLSGLPTFVGGTSPSTFAGFALTNTSLGYNAGSDGKNIGIVNTSSSGPAAPTDLSASAR